MLAPKKLSLVLALLVALAATAVIAGCGGGSSGGGGGEPASLAPKDAPVFIEANLAPDGKMSEELDEVTQTVLGIENVGQYAAEEFEKAVLEGGQKVDFEEEVEPWLGEKIGLYLEEYDGDNFTDGGIALETTNGGEAEEFLETRIEEGAKDGEGEEPEEGEFEGQKYWVSAEDESVIGVIGEFVVYAETLASFEEMVTTSEGEGLNESPKFQDAMKAAGDTGIGHVYVDIGGLIKKASGQIPPETEAFFDLAGIEPSKATAVASVVPHSEQIEVDLSTNLTKAVGQTGDASALLESLPATAALGFAAPEFGKSFGESIDELDKQGIPGQIEPGELKPALESSGINLDSIAASLGDVGGFVEGSSASNVGGAMVIATTDASEARNTVSNIGLLLRASRTPGVTALSGELTGFSVSSPSLGSQPLIVGASSEKIVIAYGTKAAAQALRSQAKTLGSTADFEAAKSALGSTPIGLFVDGGPGLKLAHSLIPAEKLGGFEEAEPLLRKIAYVGSGQESKDGVTTAKVIIGLQK